MWRCSCQSPEPWSCPGGETFSVLWVFPQAPHPCAQKAVWKKSGSLALQCSSAQGPKAAGLWGDVCRGHVCSVTVLGRCCHSSATWVMLSSQSQSWEQDFCFVEKPQCCCSQTWDVQALSSKIPFTQGTEFPFLGLAGRSELFALCCLVDMRMGRVVWSIPSHQRCSEVSLASPSLVGLLLLCSSLDAMSVKDRNLHLEELVIKTQQEPVNVRIEDKTLWTWWERVASENMQFWRLLCPVPTFVAFFNNQRKDLKDPRHSSCPEAVWDAQVKLYPKKHLPDKSCVC